VPHSVRYHAMDGVQPQPGPQACGWHLAVLQPCSHVANPCLHRRHKPHCQGAPGGVWEPQGGCQPSPGGQRTARHVRLSNKCGQKTARPTRHVGLSNKCGQRTARPTRCVGDGRPVRQPHGGSHARDLGGQEKQHEQQEARHAAHSADVDRQHAARHHACAAPAPRPRQPPTRRTRVGSERDAKVNIEP
jgi:hypothetical protein